MSKDKMGRTYLPPAKEVCEGYVFTRVCLSTGGACMAGGRAWQGGHRWQGIVHGGGACVVRGCVWQGGMHGRGRAWQEGACVVLGGGVRAMADTMGYGQ